MAEAAEAVAGAEVDLVAEAVRVAEAVVVVAAGAEVEVAEAALEAEVAEEFHRALHDSSRFPHPNWDRRGSAGTAS